jgi:hypothetical protein
MNGFSLVSAEELDQIDGGSAFIDAITNVVQQRLMSIKNAEVNVHTYGILNNTSVSVHQ